MSGYLLSTVEEIGQILGAFLMPANLGLMPNAQLLAHFGGAFFVPKKNDLHIRMEQLPALEGVTLNDIAMAFKWFGSGEDRYHLSVKSACSFELPATQG